MNMVMWNGPATKRICRTFVCALLAVVAYGGSYALAADDEDDLTFEQKIIRNILGGAGAVTGPGIEYRERSPLVIPPSLDLPRPENSAAIETNPAWPKDPDRRARKTPAKSALTPARQAAIKADESIPLTPAELNQRGPAGSGRVTSPEPDYATGSARPLTPLQLGYRGGIFSTLFGKAEDQTVFGGEPPRGSLTEPPPGYQTPSPSQPYGVRDKGWLPSIYNPMDRGTEKR